MKINSTAATGLPTVQNPASAPADSVTTPAKTAPETTVFVPTAILTGLLGQLKALPEVRDDVVRQIRDRHAKGELQSAAASAASAQAILGTETPGN
jgi:hypothetical protein